MREVPTTVAQEIHSRATIAGHPIHPMLIVFPIAFLVAALLTDITFWLTEGAFWAEASFWLLAAAVISGVLAALFGSVDFFLNARIRQLRAAWIHAGANVVVLILATINLLLRLNDPAEAVTTWGIVLSVLIAGLLVISGWFGGEMVYKHGVGVDTQDTFDNA